MFFCGFRALKYHITSATTKYYRIGNKVIRKVEDTIKNLLREKKG